jgi:hypothetical protein
MSSIISSKNWTREARRDQNPKISCGVNLFIGISFIIIGFVYAKEPCDFPVIAFLLSLGTILISSYIISQFNPGDDFQPVLALMELAVLIWGAFAILSEYSNWQYTNPEQLGFCPRLPYQALFIYLIVYYVAIGIFIFGFFILLLCFICESCFKK